MAKQVVSEETYEKILKSLPTIFDRKRQGICPFCEEKVDISALSKKAMKEFKRSGLCHKCQTVREE